MNLIVNRTKPRRIAGTLCTLFVVGIGFTFPVQAADDVLTPVLVSRLRSVTSVRISPDGSMVAYTLAVPRRPFKDEDGPSRNELHVVDVQGRDRPFVTGDVNVSDVAWTPDGRSISFLAKRSQDKHKTLYVIAVDGGEARRAINHEEDIKEYSWSPDGRRVLFVAQEKRSKEYKKRHDAGFDPEIVEEDVPTVRAWMARAFDEESKPKAMNLPGVPSEVHWNPVNSWMSVALAPTPSIDDRYMRRKLYVYDVETEALISSFPNPGKLGLVRWSPDGKRLAVLSAEDIHDPSEGRLMIADPSDGALRDLMPGFEGEVTAIAWQDAETVMFVADQGVWSTLNEIGISGSDLKTHLPTGGSTLTGLSLSRDGTCAAIVADEPTHPGEAVLMCHGQERPRRLTVSNPWLTDFSLARQEVVTFTARDGLKLEGVLIHPLHEKPGRRYPLILSVHGGPEAHDRNGWLTRYADPGQVAAARGMAVFYPNYRGSTGRGVEFSKMGQGDYGGKEFDDLIDAVDHLVSTGLVDPQKVGITGGSYGGYATAWCATRHTDRFAAGVMFVGLSDLISKYGSTDIPNEMYLVHARKRLWDDWNFFLERSPLYHVEQARTPLLIMHGKEDPRVYPGQSLELFRQLKILGKVPVRLVFYPGEGHGNRRTAARLDYNVRMIQWFEHYLMGPGGSPPPHEVEYGLPVEPTEGDEPKEP